MNQHDEHVHITTPHVLSTCSLLLRLATSCLALTQHGFSYSKKS